MVRCSKKKIERKYYEKEKLRDNNKKKKELTFDF